MYKILFEDNTTFYGGNFANSKWNEMPDKKIIKIDYQAGNKRLVMENYDGYNHQIEMAEALGHGQFISTIILMGKEGERVTKVIFNIRKHTIVREYAVLGREMNGGLSTGWKKGVENKTGVFNLFEKNR